MYADLATVRARAGRLAPAWGRETDPDEADLIGWLEECSSTLDMEIGARGIDVPVTNEDAVRVLGGIAADGVLTMALPATWPGGLPDEARGLLEGAKKRWDAAIAAIRDGTLSVVVFLEAQGEGDVSGAGATAQWVEETDYPLVGSKGYDEYVANPLAAPGAFRGMNF